MRVIAVWLLALLLAGFFLRGQVEADRAGVPTLSSLSGVRTALTATGAFVKGTLGKHLVVTRVLLLAVSLFGGLILASRRKSRADIASFAGAALLPLAATFVGSSLPLALALGLAGGVLLLPVRPAAEEDPAWATRVLVLVAVLAGGALRFHALAEVPHGYAEHAVVHHVDVSLPYRETLGAMLRSGAFVEAARTAWRYAVYEHFGLISLLAALGFELFGVSLTAARLFSAAVGTATIPLAYVAGRHLFGRRTGVLFAFLLAACPWHVVASRYGDLEHALYPFQFLLAVALYASASRSGRLGTWILAGLALGLSWFVYATNQILPVLLLPHCAARLAFDRGFRAKNGFKTLAFAAAFAAVSFAPVREILKDGLLAPNARTGYEVEGQIPVSRLERNVRMTRDVIRQLFVEVNDPFFMKPGGGLSLTEEALFVPGIILCAGGLFTAGTRWASALVLLGLPLSLLPGVLGPSAVVRRVLLTALLALLLAAVVLARVGDALEALGARRRAVQGAAVFLGAVFLAVQAHMYFDVVYVDTEDSCKYYTEMTRRVRSSMGTEFVYVYVPSAVDPLDHHRYIELGAGDELAAERAKGLSRDALYRIVSEQDLAGVLSSPSSLPDGTRLVVEAGLVSKPAAGVDLAAEVRTAFPGAKEEVRNVNGQPVLRSWKLK